jgi:dUTPase
MKQHVRLLQLIKTALHNSAESRQVYRKLLDVAPMLEPYVRLGMCLLLIGNYPRQYHPRSIVHHRLAQVKSKGTIPEDEREVKLAKVCSVRVCVCVYVFPLPCYCYTLII